MFVVLLFLIGFCCQPPKAHADGPIMHLYGGGNVAWLQGGNAEFELGANAAASLSPHISGVISAYRGMDHHYWVPRVGARVTATDADNRKLSIGVGLEYQLNESVIGPKEWCSEASLGYRPWEGGSLDPLILVAQGSYGTTSHNERVLVGARWAIKI